MSSSLKTVITVIYMYGSRKVRDCTIVDSPPFFDSVGREEQVTPEEIDKGHEGSSPTRDTGELTSTVFWSDDEGLVR